MNNNNERNNVVRVHYSGKNNYKSSHLETKSHYISQLLSSSLLCEHVVPPLLLHSYNYVLTEMKI